MLSLDVVEIAKYHLLSIRNGKCVSKGADAAQQAYELTVSILQIEDHSTSD